jgi:DUF4097 and DUF4098 domain-containing protein YvlB
VRGRKVLLLITLLASGGSVEALWRLREVGVRPAGCWFLLPDRFRGRSFNFPFEKTLEIPAGTSLAVDNAFGRVIVREGKAGVVRIRLENVVYSRDEARARGVASKVVIETHLEGTTLRVGTNRQDLEGRGELKDAGLETHLDLEVPPGTSAEVRNAHGNVEVADVAAARLDNSFGDVRLANVKGAASVVSRHGDVTLTNVGGNLSLETHYGDASIVNAAGTAAVKMEHGDLSLDHTGAADVELKNGDMKGGDIAGAFVFQGEHAEVDVSGVKGACSVATTYRDVKVSEVAGDLKVKTEHGSLTATGVGGGVSADVSFDDVSLASIKGWVEATVVHGGFKGEGLEKGARVNASGDDVVLERFRGPVTIQASRGSVELKPSGPLVDPVIVTTTNGGITLEVPSGSRFDLDASVNSGDLAVSSIPQFVSTLSSTSHVTGKLGGGGSAVRLAAQQGDVSVEAQGKP